MASDRTGLKDWLAAGQYRTVNGRKIFYRDSLEASDSDNKPVLCLLHGFPTSSFDYAAVWHLLTPHFRLIVHDHLGFGASSKPVNYSYSLIEQTDNAIALWQQLGVSECIVAAHDYGTSIATELLARTQLGFNPITIKQLILSNGSMRIELAKLKLMQKLLRSRWLGPLVARLASYRTFKRNMKAIFYAPEKLTEADIKAHWQGLITGQGRRVLSQVSQYTYERFRFWDRWIGSLRTTSIPVQLLWAKQDPIAVAAIAEAIHAECPTSELQWIESCGHFPMIEKPEIWADEIIQFTKPDAV